MQFEDTLTHCHSRSGMKSVPPRGSGGSRQQRLMPRSYEVSTTTR